MKQNSEIIIYTDSYGTTKLQVQLEDETVWLTQEQKVTDIYTTSIDYKNAAGKTADFCIEFFTKT